MIFSRNALRIAKPLWTSVRPICLHIRKRRNIPVLTSATNHDNQKRGMGDIKSENNPEALKPFLGMWCQIESRSYGPFLKKMEITDEQYNFLLTHKHWISFELVQMLWISHIGFMNTDITRCVPFFMGKPINDKFINGREMKCTCYQIGSEIHEHHVNVEGSAMTVLVQRSIRGRIMTVTLNLRGTTATLKYEKTATAGEIDIADTESRRKYTFDKTF